MTDTCARAVTIAALRPLHACDNGCCDAGSLVRATQCMVDGAGRSGFEAENGGVIELQETIVQVTCDTPRLRPR